MRLAIHQPHYFPWLGYLDKMAKVDRFVLLDDVQLTDNSNMFRNRFLSKSGREKYLSVAFQRHGHMGKPFREVQLNTHVQWQKDHANFLKDNYRRAKYFTEIWDKIRFIFDTEYKYVSDVAIDSLAVLKDILAIPTMIVVQNKLAYDTKAKKNELVLNICQITGANQYLSGNGARKYIDVDSFAQEGIQVAFQQFSCPLYRQCNSDAFVHNLSALDLLFNCGIEQSRELFWEAVKSVREFERLPLVYSKR